MTKGKNTVTVTINLDEYFCNGQDYEGYCEGSSFTDKLTSKLVERIERKYTNEIKEKLNDKIGSIADDEVSKMINKQLTEMIEGDNPITIPIYDDWGKEKGDPVTLKELFRDQMKTSLSKKVDEKGRASSYGATKPRFRWILESIAKSMFENVIEEYINNKVEDYKEIVNKDLEKLIDSKIKQSITSKLKLK